MATAGKSTTYLLCGCVVWLVMSGAASAQGDLTLAMVMSKLERAEDAAIELDGRREPAAAKAARERELKALENEVERLRAKGEGGGASAADLRAVDARLDRFIAQAGAPPAPIVDAEIPAGVEMDVRLKTAATKTNARGATPIEAVTLVDLRAGDAVLIPAGAIVRGAIVTEKTAGARGRRGAMHFYLLEIPAGSFAVDLVVAGTRAPATATAATAHATGISGGLVPARAATTRKGQEGPIVRLRFDTPLALQ